MRLAIIAGKKKSAIHVYIWSLHTKCIYRHQRRRTVRKRLRRQGTNKLHETQKRLSRRRENE